MASRHGFQGNSTVSAAFWQYIPDPSDPTGRVIFVEVNSIQFIEATPDSSKVWLYYPQNNVSTSQEPYILNGPVARAFLTDLEALFV
jgi:hypothetical protein